MPTRHFPPHPFSTAGTFSLVSLPSRSANPTHPRQLFFFLSCPLFLPIYVLFPPPFSKPSCRISRFCACLRLWVQATHSLSHTGTIWLTLPHGRSVFLGDPILTAALFLSSPINPPRSLACPDFPCVKPLLLLSDSPCRRVSLPSCVFYPERLSCFYLVRPHSCSHSFLRRVVGFGFLDYFFSLFFYRFPPG